VIYRRNAFAWSLLLAALIHALAVGWLRFPRGDSSRRQPQPLLVKLFSLAEESAAQLNRSAHIPAAASAESSAAKFTERSQKPSTVPPKADVRSQATAPAHNHAAHRDELQSATELNSAQASRREVQLEQSALRAAELARASYEQLLATWLDHAKYYPSAVRRRGLQGSGSLRVRIDRRGRVLSLSVSRALPHPILDEIAQDWVHRAEPFPAIPPSIKGENFEFLVPVSFRLD